MPSVETGRVDACDCELDSSGGEGVFRESPSTSPLTSFIDDSGLDGISIVITSLQDSRGRRLNHGLLGIAFSVLTRYDRGVEEEELLCSSFLFSSFLKMADATRGEIPRE